MVFGCIITKEALSSTPIELTIASGFIDASFSMTRGDVNGLMDILQRALNQHSERLAHQTVSEDGDCPCTDCSGRREAIANGKGYTHLA